MSDYSLRLSDAEVGRYGQMAEAAREDERDLWEAAGVRPGARVADVGCGPGAISAVLARLVGPSGGVRGVDRDASALAAARELAARSGLANAAFSQGDADATGLEPGSFDVVMMRHVLAHNGGREQAIVDHLASLARPGGTVYLVDVDAGRRGAPVLPGLEDLEEAYRALHAKRGNDLTIGRRLPDLLTAAGLEGARADDRGRTIGLRPGMRPPSWAAREALVSEGLATRGDLSRWAGVLDRLDGEGMPYEIEISQVCARARRPR
ncbi:methyltransferase domain-containing protein [Spirillospora sp. NPDC029432]|uniref:methyltransferase domain-containing protein n=1 Tax=Spirillospora sp. NPDC029432 TaxID=3154599 RepID=UPI0034569826